jgi:hypothetical protein
MAAAVFGEALRALAVALADAAGSLYLFESLFARLVQPRVQAGSPLAVLHLSADEVGELRELIAARIRAAGTGFLFRASGARALYDAVASAVCGLLVPLPAAATDAVSDAATDIPFASTRTRALLAAFLTPGVEPRLYVAAALGASGTDMCVDAFAHALRLRVRDCERERDRAWDACTALVEACMDVARLQCVGVVKVVLPCVLASLRDAPEAACARVSTWLRNALMAAGADERMGFLKHVVILSAHVPCFLDCVEAAAEPTEFESALHCAAIVLSRPRLSITSPLLFRTAHDMAYDAEGFTRGATAAEVVGALPRLILGCAGDCTWDLSLGTKRSVVAGLTARIVARLLHRGSVDCAADGAMTLWKAGHMLATLARVEARRRNCEDLFVKMFEDVVHARPENRERVLFMHLLLSTECTRAHGRVPGMRPTKTRPTCAVDADNTDNLAAELAGVLNDPRLGEGVRCATLPARRLVCVQAGYIVRFLGYAHFDENAVASEAVFLRDVCVGYGDEDVPDPVAVADSAAVAGVHKSDAALVVAAAYHGVNAPICDTLRALPAFSPQCAREFVDDPAFASMHTMDEE